MSTGLQLRRKAGVSAESPTASLSLLRLLINEKYIFLFFIVLYFFWNIIFVEITWKCHRLLMLCISYNAGEIMEHGDRVHRVLVLHQECHRFNERNNINTEFWNEIFTLTVKMISQIICLIENYSLSHTANKKKISIKLVNIKYEIK